MTDFTETISNTVIRQHRLPDSGFKNIEQYSVSDTNKTAMIPGGKTFSFRVGRDEDWRHLAVYREAFALANTGKKRRQEYGLMAEARRSFEAYEYRRTILDVATAVEVALSNHIRGKLMASNTEQVTFSIMNKFQGTRNLVELGKLLDPSLVSTTNNLVNHIATPRNKAMHHNEQVDKSMAKQAYDTGLIFLRSLLPQYEED